MAHPIQSLIDTEEATVAIRATGRGENSPSRRPLRSSAQRLLGAVACALGIGAAAGCGSSVSDAPPAPEPATPATPTATTATTGSGSPTTPSSTPDPSGEPGAPVRPAGAGGAAPTSPDAAAVEDACLTLTTDDACATCVCGACATDLDLCASAPGCPAILACVQEQGCSGRDCYCGDASLTECFRGEANGACKGVVLAAPGSKEPSLEDPSAGPASDAALAVAECAEDDDACGDVCNVD